MPLQKVAILLVFSFFFFSHISKNIATISILGHQNLLLRSLFLILVLNPFQARTVVYSKFSLYGSPKLSLIHLEQSPGKGSLQNMLRGRNLHGASSLQASNSLQVCIILPLPLLNFFFFFLPPLLPYLENLITTVFPNFVCRACSDKCKKCPICRVAIEERMPVYDV